jgi:hypothetical protein
MRRAYVHDLALRQAFANFITDHARTRGGFEVGHDGPPSENNTLARLCRPGDSGMLIFAASALGLLRGRALPANAGDYHTTSGGPDLLVASVRSLNRSEVGLPGENGPSWKMAARPASDPERTIALTTVNESASKASCNRPSRFAARPCDTA